MEALLASLFAQLIPVAISGIANAFGANAEAEQATTNARNQSEAIATSNEALQQNLAPLLQQLQASNTNGLEAEFRNAFTDSNRVSNQRLARRGLGQSDFATGSNNNLFNNFLAGQQSAINQDQLARTQAGIQATLASAPQPFINPAALQYTGADASRNLLLGGLAGVGSNLVTDGGLFGANNPDNFQSLLNAFFADAQNGVTDTGSLANFAPLGTRPTGFTQLPTSNFGIRP